MTTPSASQQDHEVVRVELAVLLLPLLRAREARRISRGSRGVGRHQAQDVAAWRGMAAWRHGGMGTMSKELRVESSSIASKVRGTGNGLRKVSVEDVGTPSGAVTSVGCMSAGSCSK